MKNTTFDIKSKVKELSEFITNRDVKEFRIKIDARKYIILKIKLTDTVDQIFLSYSYQTNGQKIDIYDKFETTGYIKDGMLYNGGYLLSSILNLLEISHWNHSFDSLMVEKKIEKYINDIIINQWEYFKKKESSNEDYYKVNAAELMVEDWVIKEKVEKAPDYKYNPYLELNHEDFVRYLDEGIKFIETKGNELIERLSSAIHNTIICWESAVKIFNEKKRLPDLIHIRNMKQSLIDLNAKTVKIKVIKDNKQTIITISINAIKNCNPKCFISLYCGCSKFDRDLFESIYGRSADLYPEDIDEIIYRNKTIYKRGE